MTDRAEIERLLNQTGRTLEEIKDKTLWCCSAMCCGECKYDADGNFCSSDIVLKEAIALIEHLESERDAALAKVPKWISVEEQLPENGRIVIGFTPCDGYMFVGYYRESQLAECKWSQWEIITAMRSSRKVTKKVTHWMPLPPSPRGE